jgi:hypothetical protein
MGSNPNTGTHANSPCKCKQAWLLAWDAPVSDYNGQLPWRWRVPVMLAVGMCVLVAAA